MLEAIQAGMCLGEMTGQRAGTLITEAGAMTPIVALEMTAEVTGETGLPEETMTGTGIGGRIGAVTAEMIGAETHAAPKALKSLMLKWTC